MDRVLFISLYEPNRYGGRMGGPVILVNDILSVADPGLDIDLVIYNRDHISSELPVNIRFIPWSEIADRTKKKNLSGLLPISLFKDYSCYTIDLQKYDRVVYYPYFAVLFKLRNNHAKFYTIGMDSGPMLYLRGFLRQKKLVMKSFCFYEFIQSLIIDKRVATVSEKVFTVGAADAGFYKSVFLADARFVHHPVTPLIDACSPIEWKEGEKLKLCIPGGMSRFYVADILDLFLCELTKNCEKYKDKIQISILGKIRYKKLEYELNSLASNGIKIEYMDFAESYEEYISQQHIILLPLAVGAGTKNKALSAFGMGLDVIGTQIAVENVYGVCKEHIACDALDFLEKIDLRLSEHKLFGYTEKKIKEFKRYHSVENWLSFFWKELC